MQGALDAAQGTAHEVRAGDRDHHPDHRDTAARQRRQMGLPARNAFERDHFLQMEQEVTACRNTLTGSQSRPVPWRPRGKPRWRDRRPDHGRLRAQQ